MAKRIFLIHGWEGTPEVNWLPWLKEQLESKGFEVHVPAMPNTDTPKIEEWVPFLKEQVGEADENTYFIGHSMGCQAILRYLQDLPENIKIGGVVLVAGFEKIKSEALEEEGEESIEISKPWLETPINWEKIKLHTNKITAIFSDDDPFVSLENVKIFEEKLEAKTIIEKNKGHFDAKEYPIILNELMELMK